MRVYTFVLITVCADMSHVCCANMVVQPEQFFSQMEEKVTHTYSECGAISCNTSDETNLRAKNNISNGITNNETQDIYTVDVQEDGALDDDDNTTVIDGKNVTVCGNITCSDKGRGCERYGVCRCLVGSWGDACDQDRDECRATISPCGGRAHCINTPGSFECVCLEGWMGEHCVIRNTSVALECLPGWTGSACDEDIDECANSSDVCPGDHNTCKNHKGGFRCSCESGWTGVNCSEDIDECLRNPCQYFATCSNLPGSYKCHCANGFTGNSCQNDIDECTGNPCLNSGTCTNSVGSFSCSCPLAWSGDICEDDLDECKNDPCLHFGSCINTPGNFSCICANNWSGRLCQNDVDECLLSPCRNEGTCVNNNGSFSCLCPSSWQGQTCSDDVDECRNTSCGFNELCTNTQGSFTCSCPTGFQGLNCTEDVDECIRKPCINNGTCVNTNGSFFCECSDESTEILCEYVTNVTRVEGHTLASLTATSVTSIVQDIHPTTTLYQYAGTTIDESYSISILAGESIDLSLRTTLQEINPTTLIHHYGYTVASLITATSTMSIFKDINPTTTVYQYDGAKYEERFSSKIPRESIDKISKTTQQHIYPTTAFIQRNATMVEENRVASILAGGSIGTASIIKQQYINPQAAIDPYNESTSNDHVNISLIVGATIGSLVAAGGVFLTAVLLMRYKWKQEHGNNLVEDSHETSLHQEGKLGQILQPDDKQRFQEVIMKTRFSWGTNIDSR